MSSRASPRSVPVRAPSAWTGGAGELSASVVCGTPPTDVRVMTTRAQSRAGVMKLGDVSIEFVSFSPDLTLMASLDKVSRKRRRPHWPGDQFWVTSDRELDRYQAWPDPRRQTRLQAR